MSTTVADEKLLALTANIQAKAQRKPPQ